MHCAGLSASAELVVSTTRDLLTVVDCFSGPTATVVKFRGQLTGGMFHLMMDVSGHRTACRIRGTASSMGHLNDVTPATM